jgi:hypothetical protein
MDPIQESGKDTQQQPGRNSTAERSKEGKDEKDVGWNKSDLRKGVACQNNPHWKERDYRDSPYPFA